MQESPLQQFAIKPIIPFHLGSYDVSFTQSSLWMVIGVVLSILLMTLSVRGKALIPGRWQNVSEMLYEAVFGLVEENLHGEAKKYFPFVFTLFMVVMMGNLLGLIPYAFTYTSHIIVTGALAMFVVGLATLIGLVKHRFHFFSLFLPGGISPWLAPLLIPLEIISYLSRPVSLSVRLCVNMMMGHTMMKLIGGFCASLIFLGFGLKGLGLITFSVNTLLMALEFMIAFIQAYVFTVLTCIYLKDAIELH